MHNDEYIIKWKFIWQMQKKQVANGMKKLIEEAIHYAMDKPKFNED